MSLYARLVSDAEASGDTRALARALTEWHDAMVRHQRHVRRAGVREACSAECPHAVAAELWKEARRVLGPAAERLEFLRECVEALAPVA
ncbi:MAG: hypothetical protein ACM3NQ_16825 [Bacteroidales bacterium]